MKILNNNGNIKLLYDYKITCKKSKYKKKNSIGTRESYQAVFPVELQEYLEIKDKTIYFNSTDTREIIVTGAPLEVEEMQPVKIQRYNQFQIPKRFMRAGAGVCRLLVDFGRVDPVSLRAGVVLVELV